MDDLARFCCQNPDCSHYGRRDAGNLSVCGRYGKHKQYRQLYCNACRARFSERKGTPLYRCRLAEATAVAILDHLAEGNGIRQTGRLVGVQPNTVVRLARAAGAHAHDAHDELVAFSPSDVRGPARREVVLRRQEAGELRPQ
jgi:LacI family transcriptional regulator